jgi:hypothetical protein
MTQRTKDRLTFLLLAVLWCVASEMDYEDHLQMTEQRK